MLRGNFPYRVMDKNIIEYVTISNKLYKVYLYVQITNRTYNREQAWDEEEHEFEHMDNQNNDLICFISKKHKCNIDLEGMKEALIQTYGDQNMD